MRTRLMVVVGMMLCVVGFSWYVAAQQATSLPTFASGQVLTAAALNAVVEQVSANTTALTGAANAAPLRVNCNAGESLAQAVQRAQPGRTIQVRGTCRERVIITTDRLTLDGQGTAVLDGGGAGNLGVATVDGVITIDGAHGISITGCTVQNGQDGIVGRRGAVFAVRDTIVQDNAVSGIRAEHTSTVEITEVTARRNGAGVEIVYTSSAIFRGTIRAVDNTITGVAIVGTSTGEFIGAILEANHNGLTGLTAGDSTHLELAGRLGGAPSQITTNNNGQMGIQLFNAVTLHTRGSTSTLTAMHNPIGLNVIGNGAIVNHPSAVIPGSFGTRFLIEQNTTGVQLDVQAAFFVIGGLTVQHNTTGLLADGANTVTVVSIPPNPSTITGNGTDVDLRFGTRATFNGVPIGTITCDDTVLSRGTTVCPPSP